MTWRPPARHGHGRRARPVRRASAGLSPVRAGAALAMLLSAAAIYGAASSPAFGLANVELEGIRFTPEADVRARLAVPSGTNLFGLATDPLEARLAGLPTVAGARVAVRLPDTLALSITERQPILVWQVGERSYLLDDGGTLFATLGAAPPPDAAALPVVEDRRETSRRLGVGSKLDPVDLDAATRLGSLRPVDVGSAAATLAVAVTDEMGFVLTTGPEGWTAVFGFYTPSLRTPDIVPGQVRLLRSLLAGRESTVDRVILASETDGTYVPKPSPTPAP